MKSRPIGPGQNILASQNNDRRDDARGSSFLLAHQQLGTLALGTNPTNGQVVPIVINGTTITVTFVSSIGVTPNNVLIGASATASVTNLLNFLRRPDVTSSTQVAASTANQTLLSYVGWSWPGSSTNVVPFSLNKNVNGIVNALSTFNITGITVTSGTWTSGTLKLYVEDGAYFINGTRYLFTGGSTPAVTAPAANPRIDVLTIDTSGTLAWTTGAENASPTAPTYPANKLPICELYNVVGETALYDNENQQAAQGYVLNDVRPTVQQTQPLTAIAADLVPDGNNTRNLGSGSFQWTVYAGTLYLNGIQQAGSKFGGTGTDGALAISSGTTTIDLAGVEVVTKNYTSISITGTGKLAFINPHANGTIVILKSQGNVTLTSSSAPMLDFSGLGASAGSSGIGTVELASAGGGNGSTGGSSSSGAGTAGAAIAYILSIAGKLIRVTPGAGGGNGAASANGGAGSASGGGGGRGGGAAIIECGGSWNFTTASGISVAGATGGAGTSGSTDQGGGGGGGGGAGGVLAVLYASSSANSGTVTVSGGNGGIGGDRGGNGSGFVSPGGGGGAGGSNLSAGGNGGNAAGSTSGSASSGSNGGGTVGGTGASGGNANGSGSNSKSPGGGGGGGGTGSSYIVANTEFS